MKGRITFMCIGSTYKIFHWYHLPSTCLESEYNPFDRPNKRQCLMLIFCLTYVHDDAYNTTVIIQNLVSVLAHFSSAARIHRRAFGRNAKSAPNITGSAPSRVATMRQRRYEAPRVSATTPTV